MVRKNNKGKNKKQMINIDLNNERKPSIIIITVLFTIKINT